MRVWFGTSGYQYKPWRGTLYPRACKDADMLATYGRLLSTVELNNTFYRMPKPGTLARWASEVPAEFRFTVKAPHWLAPVSKASAPQAFAQLGDHLDQLGGKLATVLFQSPPNVLKNVEKLGLFLEMLPPDWPACFDLRHPSWIDEEVQTLLRARGAALCSVDTDEPARDWVSGAEFGYVRLRRGSYSDAELEAALRRVQAQPWQTAYVYFKHDDGAPALVRRFAQLLGTPLPDLAEPSGAASPRAPVRNSALAGKKTVRKTARASGSAEKRKASAPRS